uniref:ABC transporter ATP-binding protein n=1 Tax=uncultured Halomonas sp. TaxID=173971 RepID=UPI00262CA0F4|nr:ABC transporter ATP-binding protein [uncultured Halomonas sp.]
MCSDVAIHVSGLGKVYRVYETPADRLKQMLFPSFSRMLNKTPPCYYHEFSALEDVSFTIKRGQTVGVIGRNGSGKSTLLQMICGTLTPTAGSIEVSGRVAALLELGAGFNSDFTGRENIYLYASVMGLSQKEIDHRYGEILSFADIGDFIEQPVKSYSSGMMLRLAFAVIANVDADILIIDEALAVGDAFFVQKCMRFLHKFMESGTVLFVSHDSAAVTNLCTHAVWLESGRVVEQGDPKSVTEKYLEQQYKKESDGMVSASAEEEVEELQRVTSDVGEASDYSDEDDFHDMRRDFLNHSLWRNDIEIHSFDPDSPSFGEKGAEVVKVTLRDAAARPLYWVVGGENAIIQIECQAYHQMDSPIIGFVVKDRLGQTLFGDNTFLGTHPLPVKRNERFRASFEFRMPILPAGQYSLCVALADGTQSDHRQHHWIHDALILTSHASSVSHGLVGIPMRRIALEPVAQPAGSQVQG